MKAKIFISLLFTAIFVACGSSNKTSVQSYKTLDYGSPNVDQILLDVNTFRIEIYTEDGTYGYSEENPIMVGNSGGSGPQNQRRFLNALMGPNGEAITYIRLDSCCPFKTKNGTLDNNGFLDKYSVVHKGLDKEVILYLNMYDSDTLKIPVGFQKKRYHSY